MSSSALWVIFGGPAIASALYLLYRRRSVHTEHWFRLTELLAFIYSIAGLFIAVEHLSHLSGLEGRLDKEISALPTKSVGTFPETLDDVRHLLDRATKHLDVFIDYAGYGLQPTV